ncbi:hypothetical protein STEG23_034944 [Scotinomys teguina]
MDEITKRANCEVAEASPWFTTGGGLNIPDWEQVKVDLQKALRKKGMDNVPLVTFSIWPLIEDALLTDKVKVKEQLVEAEQSLEKIQEEEVRKSVSATDTQSEDKEESQFETKAQEVKVKVKEFSFSSSSESDSEEEESHSDGCEETALYDLNFLGKLISEHLFHIPADQLHVFFSWGPLPIKQLKLFPYYWCVSDNFVKD